MTHDTRSDVVRESVIAANEMVLGLFGIILSPKSSQEQCDAAVKPQELFIAIRDILSRAAVKGAPTSEDLALARAVIAFGKNGDAS